MKLALALGGGGARGFAHIGVLRALEELGLEPVAVAGCSMGAIVGAFVASGADSARIHSAFEDMSAVSLIDWSSKGGLIGGRGLEKQIRQHLPERFEDLKLPFRCTAVDIQDGRPYVFSRGEITVALRASSAVPGLFSPVEHEGRILVDGGLLGSVPVDEARGLSPEPVLAVDVTAPPDRSLVFEDQRGFLEKLRSPLLTGKRPLFIEMLMKAYEIPASLLSELQVVAARPEYLVRPPLDKDLKLEDFHRMDEAVEAGYQEAMRVLGSLGPDA